VELEESTREVNFGSCAKTPLAVSFAGMHADILKNTSFPIAVLHLEVWWD